MKPGMVHFGAVEPRTRGPVFCPHFGPCGGCSELDLHYTAELERKEAAFRSLVVATPALRGAEVLPILGARQPLFWRTSLKLPFARRGRRCVCGFFEPGSHRIVDLQTCAVQHPLLLELALETRALVQRLRVPVYDEIAHRGVLRHLVARVGMGTEELLAGLVVREEGHPAVARLAQGLWERFANRGLVGVVESLNPERTNVILGGRVRRLAGREWLEEHGDGLAFRTSLATFVQVNNAQAEVLYGEIGRFLGEVKGKRIADLYSGFGPIGLRLARRGAKVLAVERNDAAVREGVEAARRNGLEKNLRFVGGAVETVLPRLGLTASKGPARNESGRGVRSQPGGIGPSARDLDVVVVDPPRRGLTPGLIEQFGALRFPTLLYVSCNPKSLVRDLELLSARFELRCLRLVDLFPRTTHVEALALLERRAEPE